MNNKIRIRSDEELNDRKKCFLEICETLEELKITYFLVGGVLLGAKRDKNFIEWDCNGYKEAGLSLDFVFKGDMLINASNPGQPVKAGLQTVISDLNNIVFQRDRKQYLVFCRDIVDAIGWKSI